MSLALLRRVHAWYRRRRQVADAYEVLRGLDDLTLRDLGFHRSEIWSVAAEVAGDAERSRVRAGYR